MKKNTLLIGIFSFFLTNCAEKEFIALHDSGKQYIKSTKVYMEEPRTKLGAQINASNITGTMGGGLLWALVDASINESRQTCADEAIKHLQDEFTSCDLEKILNRKLSRSLDVAKWMNVRSLVVNRDLSADNLSKVLQTSDTDAASVVRFSYSLTPNMDSLSATIHFIVYPLSKSLQENLKTTAPILKFNIKKSESISSLKGSLEENAKQWSGRIGQSVEKLTDQLFVELDKVLANTSTIQEK